MEIIIKGFHIENQRDGVSGGMEQSILTAILNNFSKLK